MLQSSYYISKLPFELLLIITRMLRNTDFIKFVTAFQDLYTFEPLLSLLQLSKTVGIEEVWPIRIVRPLSPRDCTLVHEASHFSQTITFAGQTSLIRTIQTCNISQTWKVSLHLDGCQISRSDIADLRDFRIYEIQLYCVQVDRSIDGTEFVDALASNTNLRSLRLTFLEGSPQFRSKVFASVGLLKSLASFSWCNVYTEKISVKDCQLLGNSLRSTSITELKVGRLEWDGLVELAARLPDTAVTKFTIWNCVDEYSKDNAKQFLEHLVYSKVKALAILEACLTDSFAVLLATTDNLSLCSLDLRSNHLTKTGMTVLVQMIMPSLKLLDLIGKF